MSDQSHPTSKDWNYHPELPLADPSIFRWPPEPGFLVRWFGRNWLTLSERMLMVILAVVLWLVAYPSLEQAQTWSIGWVAQTFFVNLVMMVVVAGGLHWYFYMRQGQGQTCEVEVVHDVVLRESECECECF